MTKAEIEAMGAAVFLEASGQIACAVAYMVEKGVPFDVAKAAARRAAKATLDYIDELDLKEANLHLKPEPS